MPRTREVRLALISMYPDSTGYKQYGMTLGPTADRPITVRVNVPADLFDGDDLTPGGIAYVADQFIRATDKLNRKRVEE